MLFCRAAGERLLGGGEAELFTPLVPPALSASPHRTVGPS